MSTHTPWKPSSTWRSLTDNERALLVALTSQDFIGAVELRNQIDHTLAQQGCGCGCGTINLAVDRNRVPAAECPVQPTPGEASVLDQAGNNVGRLILFARDGYLGCLEIHTWGDSLPLPRRDNIRPFVRS